MMPVPAQTKVWLAAGVSDMRKVFTGRSRWSFGRETTRAGAGDTYNNFMAVWEAPPIGD